MAKELRRMGLSCLTEFSNKMRSFHSLRAVERQPELATIGFEAFERSTSFAASRFRGGDGFLFMSTVGADLFVMCSGTNVGT